MTFDEEIKKIYSMFLINLNKTSMDEENKFFYMEDLHDVVEGLRKEYAPTVEMTKGQKDNLVFMQQEGYSFVETIADIDSGVLIREFDSYWKPLTQEQLMQAWLHPDTIKIIDEEK